VAVSWHAKKPLSSKSENGADERWHEDNLSKNMGESVVVAVAVQWKDRRRP